MTASTETPRAGHWLARSLHRDRLALCSLVWFCALGVAILLEIVGAFDSNAKIDLSARNLPPLHFDRHWTLWLGADALGRSLSGRLAQAAATSLGIALSAVVISLVFGTALGLVAGFFRGLASSVIMRTADIVMGFPTLLVALVSLYLFGPNATNLVLVLAITRMPAYIRVARAEVLEVRERLFVDAARVVGAGSWWIIRIHILPIIAPTLLTLASLNIAMVMLFESGLSFLGLGIQPPAVSWGLMVAQGQAYLSTAWWLACLPGLAIMLTTMSFNFLANWWRTAGDPSLRWQGNGE